MALDNRPGATTEGVSPERARVRRVGRFLRLSPLDRLALLRAGVLVISVRAALSIVPFRHVLRAADRFASRLAARRGGPEERERMLRAVETAGRHLLPAGPCLSQAIVSDVLLRRRGWPSQLYIGVARGPDGSLRAHAWVESDGEVVVGGTESPRDFVPLPDPRRAP